MPFSINTAEQFSIVKRIKDARKNIHPSTILILSQLQQFLYCNAILVAINKTRGLVITILRKRHNSEARSKITEKGLRERVRKKGGKKGRERELVVRSDRDNGTLFESPIYVTSDRLEILILSPAWVLSAVLGAARHNLGDAERYLQNDALGKRAPACNVHHRTVDIVERQKPRFVSISWPVTRIRARVSNNACNKFALVPCSRRLWVFSSFSELC